ncbi:EamA family transporter [Candidatus Uhrbacteria bacterium]|nr:EamA family transporter [Candidatus Uhrbacteria bacterium]
MWIVYGLLAAVTAALMTIVGKVGLKNVDPTLATAVRSAFMFLFMLTTVMASGKFQAITKLQTRDWGIIGLAGVFGAASWLFYFLGLRATTASKLAALDRLSLPLIILFSVIFLAEKISWQLVVGGIMVTIGAILVALA